MNEKEYIAKCRKQIEEKFNLNRNLIERDFEYLHEVILERTKTDLSTSTLRRVWSDKYQSFPQTKTLDALAQVLGHAGWHAFRQAQQQAGEKSIWLSARTIAYILGIGLAVTSILLLTSTDEAIGEVSLNPEVQVHEGVPATIGFDYSVKSPNVDIELSWNPYERARLNENQNYYTGTYFYPDYHTAKLLHGEQVLATSPVHVTVKGWHGLIMDAGYDSNPTYMDSTEYLSGNKLSVSRESLEDIWEHSGIALPVFTLSHLDLSSLSGDDFTLKAEVKSQALSKDQSCVFYEVLIKGESGNIRVPISQVGCYGLTELKCVNKIVTGKLNDLSALSTDLSQHHQVSMQLKENELLIKVANNPVFSLSYLDQIGSLKVIKFIFQGPSEISSFELQDAEGIRLQSESLHPF